MVVPDLLALATLIALKQLTDDFRACGPIIGSSAAVSATSRS